MRTVGTVILEIKQVFVFQKLYKATDSREYNRLRAASLEEQDTQNDFFVPCAQSLQDSTDLREKTDSKQSTIIR